MQIWIDADACPKVAKELIFKFAHKRNLQVVMVAGQSQIKPIYQWVSLIVVPTGMDAADDYLVEHAKANDLVICSDIPLADRLIKKQVAVLHPKGNEFTQENMSQTLAMRNLFTELREQGQITSQQASYGAKDKQNFANALDRLLTKLAAK
ncbi:YaiI/YqxD family protein [Gammaproteobacteria bacterium ESL0073]|nr:YaiI/YqxD family protein [Gammaproteobacteria bacterium ESL0073]